MIINSRNQQQIRQCRPRMATLHALYDASSKATSVVHAAIIIKHITICKDNIDTLLSPPWPSVNNLGGIDAFRIGTVTVPQIRTICSGKSEGTGLGYKMQPLLLQNTLIRTHRMSCPTPRWAFGRVSSCCIPSRLVTLHILRN